MPGIGQASFSRTLGGEEGNEDYYTSEWGGSSSSGDRSVTPLDKIPTNELIDNFLDNQPEPEVEEQNDDERKSSTTRAPLASAHRKASGSIRSAKLTPVEAQREDDTETVLGIQDHVAPYDDTGQLAYHRACKKFNALPISSLSRNLGKSTSISVKHYGTGPIGAKALAVPMVINSTVTSLNLAGNGLSAKGLDPIVRMMAENDFILHLNLAENGLKSEGAKLVATMLEQNHNIESLDLSGNGFTSTDAVVLCKAVEDHPNLHILNLSKNEFGEMAGKALRNMIGESGTLHELDLSWNQIRGRATFEVAKGMKDSVGLKKLDLSWNGFGDNGTMEVAASLKWCTINELDLTSNRIASAGVLALGKALKINDDLQVLRLGKNPLSEEAVKIMLDLLIKLEELHLETLDLSDVLFSPSFNQKIEDVRSKHAGFSCNHGYSDSYGKRKLKTYSVVGEAMNAMRQYCDEHNMNIVELFSRFDADGSMSVSHDEFRLGLKEAKIALSDFQVDELIRSLDQDGDGEIDFRERLYKYRRRRAL